MLVQRARRQPRRGRVRATPSAARTSWSSTATAWPSTRTARILARCPQFEEASRSARSTRARSPPPACATRATAPTCAASGEPRRSPTRRSSTLAQPRGRRRRRDRAAARWPTCSSPRPRSTRRCAPACATTCDKNGFEHVVLGLSGGIDSALVALIAADALGPERVTCVSMPSPYSSEGTQADAARDRGQPRRSTSARSRSRTRWRPTTRCWRTPSPGASPTSPRRTSRRASAATW